MAGKKPQYLVANPSKDPAAATKDTVKTVAIVTTKK
jgi:hypothetical protein